MPGAATITQFQGQTPPWSLVSLDANFTALNALAKDVGNYSTYIADAGGANAYSCTYGVTLTFSLATGVMVSFKAANANTGASTLNVNATGIKNILNVDGTALSANQIVAGGIYTVVYDGTQYQLLNPTQGIVNRNAVITGTLSVSGDFAVNTNKFTVAGASGNTLVAGTLSQTAGNVTLNTSSGITVIGGSFTGGSASTGDLVLTNTKGVRSVNGLATDSYKMLFGDSGNGVSLATPGGTQFHIVDAGSAVNYVEIQGAATGNSPRLYAAGNDTNITQEIWSKGTGSIRLMTNSGGNDQVRVLHTASSNRYVTLTGSNGGTVAIGASAGGVAISAGLIVTGTAFPTTGAGPQLAYFGGESTLVSYDRDASAYKNMNIDGAILTGKVSGAESWRTTAAGYFKASNASTYHGISSPYHELYQSSDASNEIIILKHAGATANNQYGLTLLLTGDPNNTTNYFSKFLGNATERFTARSNGGLANFSANNVNLCSLSVKKDFTPLADVPGMLDRMWEAHRELDWAQYRYKDQTHEEFNYGPSAERVHELFTKRGIPLTDAWQPDVERVSAGAVTIGGLSYDYRVTRREENADSPLGITGDFAYVTGAMVSYAQKRIERIEAALVKAKLL